jgi:radical SAM superfamily enzyme YgiQ (UPF0313 family)
MKPHVTLVNPPFPKGSSGHMPVIPLGLGYLAAVLEINHYEVDVIDCPALKLSCEETRSEISKRQPDIVGITCATLTYKSALSIAKMVKETCPNCLTILGGIQATFWEDKVLQECPDLDVVVRREGEYTLLELVQKLEAGKSFRDVLGISYRKDGKITRNPDRPYIENLDEIPFPARHLWPIERIRKYEDMFYLIMSRGCVYWCEFCSTVRMHGRKFRSRSPKNVADELEFLHDTYGATVFTFVDDIFTLDKAKIEELCQEIKNRKLKITWTCGTRIDAVTKELLLEMKDAGCERVWFGVESSSQNVLDEMRKGLTPAQTVKVMTWMREIGLKPFPNVILGFPGNDKQAVWETIRFAEKISPDNIACYDIATPFPGTPLFELVKEKGYLKITDFDKYDINTPVFETPQLSMKELKKIREQAFQHFYLRPTYILGQYAKGVFYGLSATRTAGTYLLIIVRSKLQHDNLPREKSYAKGDMKTQ